MESKPKRPTVIIADDNPAIHPLISRVLRRELDVVESVFDGKALVEATNRLRPDLIVVDVYMPVMDGIEALKRVHGRFPDLPVVVISTDVGEENMQRARLAGAHAIVEKASAAEKLLPAARAALSGRRSADGAQRQTTSEIVQSIRLSESLDWTKLSSLSSDVDNVVQQSLGMPASRRTLARGAH